MAESRKRPDEKPEQSGTAPSGTESAASQVLRGLRDSVKAELRDAAEAASLKMHLARAEKEKKELFRKLGEVSYERLRPKHGSVQSELDARAESLAVRIGQKTREISDLRLKLKLRKLGGDYSHLTGDKK